MWFQGKAGTGQGGQYSERIHTRVGFPPPEKSAPGTAWPGGKGVPADMNVREKPLVDTRKSY